MFTPEEVLIFDFLVEGKPRFVDPLEVADRIRSLAGEPLDTLWQKIQQRRPKPGPDGPIECSQADFEVGYEAETRLVNAVTEAFDLPRTDAATGKGYSREQVISLWNYFQDWQQKKNGSIIS